MVEQNQEIQSVRRRCMGVMARARIDDVEALWRNMRDRPEWQILRKPERGMVMVRGRAGGTGQPFNLGEMTVTRCAVTLESGQVGHGYVAGRDARRAELTAVVDAMAHEPARRDALFRSLIAPLEIMITEAEQVRSKKVASTKVDFFGLVRHRT